MTQPDYIFIVGSGRSGTSTMRHILNSSEDVAICAETHFLGHRIRGGFRHKFAEIGDISTNAGVREVVDYIYRIKDTTTFWPWVQQNVDREEFLSKLLASDRTDRALFDLVMAFFADGKPVRGEKTPPHIYHVPTLLDWFPNARIVHLVRDPRAVYASVRAKIATRDTNYHLYRFVRKSELGLSLFSSYLVLSGWRRIIQLHHQYEKDYPQNYYWLRFEDLIRDPKETVTMLCDFLGIDFSEAMIRSRVPNTSFGPRGGRPAGFDTSSIDRWRKHVHPLMDRWFVLVCGKQLEEFGYQP